MDFLRPIEAVVPGVQGRVLAVLVETTAELSLRTVAELAGASQAQASRVLPGLVALGMVERREVPPSSLFRLVREHVASRALLDLARATDTVLSEMGTLAGRMQPSPISVAVFGSFARREAHADSDIDVLMVRSGEVDEDDEEWSSSVERWRDAVRRLTGNPVEILEVNTDEAASGVGSRRQIWSDIRRDRVVVYGLDLDELRGALSA